MELQLTRVESECTSAASTGADFDGDGIDDRTVFEKVDHGRAIVESGRDGSVLLESIEPLEYESNDRLTLLGDLDGDGFSELAVAHPRDDRSKYDWELFDAVFGAKSWLSVVSGRLGTGKR